MEQSFVNEDERQTSALYNTELNKVTFLKRIEAQNKERGDFVSYKSGQNSQKMEAARGKQALELKKMNKKRIMLEKKSEKQNSQVKATKDRNLSQIELNAEKRRLL